MHRYQVCVCAVNGNSALEIAKEKFNKKTDVSRTVMLWEGPDK